MAKPELGTKRICPETGRKFYDLNKDPIVSPYTGMTYARSYFEGGSIAREEEEEVETKELDAEEGAEIVSLEDADEEAKGDDLPDLDDEEDVDLGDDDDTFLADDEEEDDDVADIIGVGGEDDDEV
ncbi:MAG: TIGR02300 family protein [Mesorhizobium sp.]